MRWAVLIVLAACYSPRIPAGLPCGEGEACPRGQVCESGLCTTTPGVDSSVDEMVVVDAAPDAQTDASIDAPPDVAIDAPPVPPIMRFGDRTGAMAGTLRDMFLTSDTDNTGAHNDLHFRDELDRPVILRVDVSSVPSNASVTGARLGFYVSSDSFPAGTTIAVYPMLESWTKGTEDYTPGIANRLQRNAGQAWSTSGARPPSRAAAAVATATVPAALAIDDELVITLPPALIAGWIAAPATNHGIAILVTTPGFYAEVDSTESSSASQRPMLELMLQ
ncbi:MAG: DNRLRE domain-containing protein [Myxococcales bacterium]|nr:DNRLRE domain-containing protein [Myxococcales bacterium]